MQNFVDSLCQCFGTTGHKPGTGRGSTPLETMGTSLRHQHPTAEGQDPSRKNSEIQPRTPSSMDGKRRTRSLALMEKQWDVLFAGDQHTTTTQQPHRRVASMDQARCMAKAKLAATSAKQHQLRNYKRKRSCGRDDIFRSKQDHAVNSNPLSRFLSKNPVISNALCFANPIHSSPDLCDAGSVVSESNTLNTAEDTITSTLYYEKTKLAGLKQKNPPVPLFNCFAVEPKDDIHQIVLTHSHSSVKLLDMYSRDNRIILEEEDEMTPPTTPARPPFQQAEGHRTPPPPITKLSSSESSKSSRR